MKLSKRGDTFRSVCVLLCLALFANCGAAKPGEIHAKRLSNDLGIPVATLTLIGGDYTRSRETISVFRFQVSQSETLTEFQNVTESPGYDEYKTWINDAMQWSHLDYRVPDGAKISKYTGKDYTVLRVSAGGKTSILVYLAGV